MPIKYDKINTLYKRDNKGKIIYGDWATPEIEYLKDNQWVFTEKVDGTNIRIVISRKDDHVDVTFYGRTDHAVIPNHLLNYLESYFASNTFKSNVYNLMTDREIHEIIIFGEGYGPKIQGGGKYLPHHSFVVFDVLIDGKWYLNLEDVDIFCFDLGIDMVPILFHGDLTDAENYVRLGQKSRWGDFIAEGVVGRPIVRLLDINGNRVLVKIKIKDFQ